jgi:acylphosphatase
VNHNLYDAAHLHKIPQFININNAMSRIAKHIIFTGTVQGVGFRFTVLRIADRFDLAGWVRNLPDGSVEMLAQGLPEDIDDCIRNIQNSFSGYIRETKVQQIPPEPNCTDFKITF